LITINLHDDGPIRQGAVRIDGYQGPTAAASISLNTAKNVREMRPLMAQSAEFLGMFAKAESVRAV
jgi:hypothetical protein